MCTCIYDIGNRNEVPRMKHKSRFLLPILTFLTFGMVAGSIVVTSSSDSHLVGDNSNVFHAANAEAEKDPNARFYFKPGSNWASANAVSGICFQKADGTGDVWGKFTFSGTNDYGYCDLPTLTNDHTKFFFVRLRPSGAEGYSGDNGGLNWTNKWSQSNQVTYDKTKNMFEIPNNEWGDFTPTSSKVVPLGREMTIYWYDTGGWGIDPYIHYQDYDGGWTDLEAMTTEKSTIGDFLARFDLPKDIINVQFSHTDYYAGSTNNITFVNDNTNGWKNRVQTVSSGGSGAKWNGTWGYHTGLYNVVRYHSNGGTGTVADTYLNLDSGTLSNGSGFTRDGRSIDHWNTKDDGTGISYALSLSNAFTYKNIPSMIAGYVFNLYAQWDYPNGWYIVGQGISTDGVSYSTEWNVRSAIPADAVTDAGNSAQWTDVYFDVSENAEKYGDDPEDYGFKIAYYHQEYHDFDWENAHSVLSDNTRASPTYNDWFSNYNDDTSKNLLCNSGAAGKYNVYIKDNSESFKIYISQSVRVRSYKYIQGVETLLDTAQRSTDDTYSLSKPATPAGYEAVGGANTWKVGGPTSETTFVSGSYPTEAMDIYAVYNPIQSVVTLDKNAADATAGTLEVTGTYDSPMPEATMPKRVGYVFDGYYDSLGTKYYNAGGTSAKIWDKTEATTLYARWTNDVLTYTVNLTSSIGITINLNEIYKNTHSINKVVVVKPVAEKLDGSTETDTYTVFNAMYEEINAAQMTDTITVSLYHDSTKIGSDIETTVADILESKRVEYAAAGTTQGTKNSNLCAALMVYGGYVQIANGYHAGDLAFSRIASSDVRNSMLTELASKTIASNPGVAAVTGGLFESSNISISAAIGTNLCWRMYFECSDEEVAYYSATSARHLTNSGNPDNYTISKTQTYRFFEIDDIKAYDVNTTFTVTVTNSDSGETSTITYSVQQYLYNVLQSTSVNATYKNLAKAILLYRDYAIAARS